MGIILYEVSVKRSLYLMKGEFQGKKKLF